MEKNNIDQFENSLRPEINKNVFGTLAIDLGSSTIVVIFQKLLAQKLADSNDERHAIMVELTKCEWKKLSSTVIFVSIEWD